MCSGILTGIISKVWEGVIEKMQSILFLFYLKESVMMHRLTTIVFHLTMG